MINPETIEDIDDCDSEAAFVYGFDTEQRRRIWAWLSLEYLYDSGRSDIIDRLFPPGEQAA